MDTEQLQGVKIAKRGRFQSLFRQKLLPWHGSGGPFTDCICVCTRVTCDTGKSERLLQWLDTAENHFPSRCPYVAFIRAHLHGDPNLLNAPHHFHTNSLQEVLFAQHRSIETATTTWDKGSLSGGEETPVLTNQHQQKP
eukprot:2531941-Rhodomonas_salina.1